MKSVTRSSNNKKNAVVNNYVVLQHDSWLNKFLKLPKRAPSLLLLVVIVYSNNYPNYKQLNY